MLSLSESRTISLWQPWASAVAIGLKKFETRSWPTSYRGPLLVHAAKRWTEKERSFRTAALSRLQRLGVGIDLRRTFLGNSSVLGCIVAVADLVECRSTSQGSLLLQADGSLTFPGLTELEMVFGDFSPGRFAWQLENVIRLREPVPCRGMQGLWTPDAETVDRVSEQLMEPAAQEKSPAAMPGK